jgi:hypothetical protein
MSWIEAPSMLSKRGSWPAVPLCGGPIESPVDGCPATPGSGGEVDGEVATSSCTEAVAG